MILVELNNRPSSIKEEKNNSYKILLESKNTTPLFEIEWDFKFIKNEDWLYLFEDSRERLFWLSIIKNSNIEEVWKSIYSQIFKLIWKSSLYRTWNFIPEINSIKNWTEIYQQFNSWRFKAFSEYFWNEKIIFPAATAIDVKSEEMVIAFLAWKKEPEHFKNPNQVQPINYSKKYWKSPPLFSRAAKIGDDIFISWTASIKWEETFYKWNVQKQLELTFENLKTMLDETWVQKEKITNTGAVLYIRNKKDFELVESKFKKEFPEIVNFSCVVSNICRNDLDVEIEIYIKQ